MKHCYRHINLCCANTLSVLNLQAGSCDRSVKKCVWSERPLPLPIQSVYSHEIHAMMPADTPP